MGGGRGRCCWRRANENKGNVKKEDKRRKKDKELTRKQKAGIHGMNENGRRERERGR